MQLTSPLAKAEGILIGKGEQLAELKKVPF